MSDPKYTFVVEHLDPELGPWSALEYKTIAKESQESGCQFILSSVPETLLRSQDLKDVQAAGAAARNDSVETYFADRKEKICLLDPGAQQELSPSDAQVFDVFLFGGILGKSALRSLQSASLISIHQATTLHEVRQCSTLHLKTVALPRFCSLSNASQIGQVSCARRDSPDDASVPSR